MKALFILLICSYSVSNGQTSELIGTWNIIEFSVINENTNNNKTKAQLNELGSIWNLFILENGKFKQTSNMYSGNSETHEGDWSSIDSKLTFTLEINDNKIDLEYTYELKEDVLTLTRGNPSGTMKVIAKFEKRK